MFEVGKKYHVRGPKTSVENGKFIESYFIGSLEIFRFSNGKCIKNFSSIYLDGCNIYDASKNKLIHRKSVVSKIAPVPTIPMIHDGAKKMKRANIRIRQKNIRRQVELKKIEIESKNANKILQKGIAALDRAIIMEKNKAKNKNKIMRAELELKNVGNNETITVPEKIEIRKPTIDYPKELYVLGQMVYLTDIPMKVKWKITELKPETVVIEVPGVLKQECLYSQISPT